MPRRIVYGISLWLFLGAAACTIASVALPNWVTYTSPTPHDPIRVRYGLHTRCSSITKECKPFPTDEDCHGDGHFCAMWRTTGFLLNFALMVELAVVVAYTVVLVGGRGVRESGWKMVAGLLGLIAGVELVAMALVAYLYDHDNRFFVGWELDKSWILCTVSWIVLAVDAVGLVGAKFVLPNEDDYELIPEPQE